MDNISKSFFLIKYISKIAKGYLRRSGYVVTISYDDNRRKLLKLIDKIKTEVSFLLSDNEAYQLYTTTKCMKKIRGDIAEVGIFEGGSSKLICEAKGNKKLYIFDTFQGLPEVGKVDTRFHIGQYKSSYEDVKEYLKKYKNIYIYKGLFPDSAKSIKNNIFSFVHIDVDTYKSTKDCLDFFYPRLNTGGVIISHDYVNSPGVKKAFDEFFNTKAEAVIPLIDRQCMIQKINYF